MKLDKLFSYENIATHLSGKNRSKCGNELKKNKNKYDDTSAASWSTLSSEMSSRKRRTFTSLHRGTNGGDGCSDTDETEGVMSDSNYDEEDYEDIEELIHSSPLETQKAAIQTDDVNELLSQELMKMTLLDRNDIQEEIHGVRCLCVQESPELLEKSLKEFQFQLDALPVSQKKTYNQIVLANEEQVSSMQPDNKNSNTSPTNKTSKHYAIEDENFRLRFLRAELFDVKRAVLRFTNYMEFVHEFWGFEIVSKRKIRLSDFSKAELKFFKKGYFQLLPFRDRSGRRVVIVLGENKTSGQKVSYEADATTKAKCYFYLWDIATRDSVESQRKGVVAVAHPNGICFEMQNHELHLVHRLSVSVPSRMVASHNFCHDWSGYTLLAKVVAAHVISGSKHKQIIRQKFHVGMNDTELRYYLQGFGIPVQFFPLTETGTIKLNYFLKWIKTRSYLESREEELERDDDTTNISKPNKATMKKKEDKGVVVVECPLLNDVVFRQGKPYKANPGNDILRDSILEEMNRKMQKSMAFSKASHAAANDDKSSFSNSSNTSDSTERFCHWLIDEIESNRKGRFLTWDGPLNSWIQIHDKYKIRRKISVSLYNWEKRHSEALGRMQRSQKSQQSLQSHQSMPSIRPPSPDTVQSASSVSDLSTSQPDLTTSHHAPQVISGEMVDLDLSTSYRSAQQHLGGGSDELAYQFIEGGKKKSSQFCCTTTNQSGNKNDQTGDGERKRPRDNAFS